MYIHALKMTRTSYSLAVFFLLIFQVLALNKGGCNFTSFTDSQWETGWVYNKQLTDTTYVFDQWRSESLVEFAEVSNPDYFNISIQENEEDIMVTVIMAMHKIDEDTPTTRRDVTAVSTELTFNCGDPEANSTIQLFVIVRDTNNNLPRFDKVQYAFFLNVDDIGQDTDIVELGGGILVQDLDFTNDRIHFEIEPADIFRVSTWNLGNKTYRPALYVANRDKFLSYTDRYVITAQDHGYDNEGDEMSNVATTFLIITLTN